MAGPYYLDYVNGSDSNNGLGPDASHATNKPWTSLSSSARVHLVDALARYSARVLQDAPMLHRAEWPKSGSVQPGGTFGRARQGSLIRQRRASACGSHPSMSGEPSSDVRRHVATRGAVVYRSVRREQHAPGAARSHVALPSLGAPSTPCLPSYRLDVRGTDAQAARRGDCHTSGRRTDHSGLVHWSTPKRLDTPASGDSRPIRRRTPSVRLFLAKASRCPSARPWPRKAPRSFRRALLPAEPVPTGRCRTDYRTACEASASRIARMPSLNFLTSWCFIVPRLVTRRG